MALIKDMISSPKIQLLKAPFLVRLIATDHSEVIYDAKLILSGKFEPMPLCLLAQWYKSNGSNELEQMKIWYICYSPACLNHVFFVKQCN